MAIPMGKVVAFFKMVTVSVPPVLPPPAGGVGGGATSLFLHDATQISKADSNGTKCLVERCFTQLGFTIVNINFKKEGRMKNHPSVNDCLLRENCSALKNLISWILIGLLFICTHVQSVNLSLRNRPQVKFRINCPRESLRRMVAISRTGDPV